MSMQSQTLKIVTLVFAVIYALTWSVISIKAGAMVVPPAELNAGLVSLLIGKMADGVVGKVVDRRQGGL